MPTSLDAIQVTGSPLIASGMDTSTSLPVYAVIVSVPSVLVVNWNCAFAKGGSEKSNRNASPKARKNHKSGGATLHACPFLDMQGAYGGSRAKSMLIGCWKCLEIECDADWSWFAFHLCPST